MSLKIKQNGQWVPLNANDSYATKTEVSQKQDSGDYVEFSDYANSTTAGVVKARYDLGIEMYNNQFVAVKPAESSHIKAGDGSRRPIVPGQQHMATFYGLAKAAGDTTQSASSNAIGQYTDDAKEAIKEMFGIEEGADVIVSDTEPVGQEEGDLWFDPSDEEDYESSIGWVLIADYTFEEDAASFYVDKDVDNLDFCVDEVVFYIEFPTFGGENRSSYAAIWLNKAENSGFYLSNAIYYTNYAMLVPSATYPRYVYFHFTPMGFGEQLLTGYRDNTSTTLTTNTEFKKTAYTDIKSIGIKGSSTGLFESGCKIRILGRKI